MCVSFAHMLQTPSPPPPPLPKQQEKNSHSHSWQIAAPVLLRGTFTLSLWALPATRVTLFTTSTSTSTFVADTSYPFVVSQALPQSAPAGVCYLSVVIGLNGVVLLAQRSAATIPIMMYSRPTPAATWAQYLVSVNNSVASLYIDGSLVAVSVAPAGCTLAYFADRIGTGRTAANVVGNYSGQLDDMTLYNTSFTATDALTAYTTDIDNARQCFRLAPDDYPSYRVDVGTGGIVLVAPTTTDTFRLVRGLTGDTDSVSFLLCSSTNRYLTVNQAFNAAGFALVTLQTFNGSSTAAQLATFIRRRDLFVNGSSSYESYRYPQFFMRNRGANNGFRVAIEQVTENSPVSFQQVCVCVCVCVCVSLCVCVFRRDEAEIQTELYWKSGKHVRGCSLMQLSPDSEARHKM
jgi:hypothetical protein